MHIFWDDAHIFIYINKLKMNIPIILLIEMTPGRKYYHYFKASLNMKTLKYVNATLRHVPTHVPQRIQV